jgi:hypothetical protein
MMSVQDGIEQMIGKLQALEREVSSEKGDFSLFGLFLREDAQDRWDLLVSAPWLEKDKKEGIQYMAGELQQRLDAQERLSLSRVVILEKDNPVLTAIHRMAKVSHGRIAVKDSVVFGLEIKQAYVITSRSA